MFRSKYDEKIVRIEDARQKVEEAAQEYAKGGSLQALNRANRELADAHADYRVCYGLRVPIPGR